MVSTSPTIQEDLSASGVAPVIVVLKQTTTAAATAGARQAKDISRYFVTSEFSQESALVTEATFRAGAGGDPVGARLSAKAASGAREAVGASLRFRARPAVVQAPIPEAEPPPLVRYYPNLGVALGNVTAEGLAALRNDAQVEEVVGAPRIGLIRPTHRAAAALRAQITWGIRRLRVPTLWDQGLSGKGVRVGHLDTGVDGAHPALEAAIATFAEFDYFGREIVPTPRPHDTEDHGTHTAATIAGRPQARHNLGVAPAAELASAIVIEGGQIIARVLGGMDWAVGQGVRILNMSLGLVGAMQDFLPLTQILRARGILPVFAVGNEGPGTSRAPGNYSETLSVGAMDRENRVADFSSSQRFTRAQDPTVPDVVAPGVGIISARPGGGYQSMDGSSMATPHIAGLAALLLEAQPTATVDQLEQAIFGSCLLEPGWPPERAGRGVPDAVQALEMISQ